MINLRCVRPALLAALALLLTACLGTPERAETPPPAAAGIPEPEPVRIGLALGGGAAKGFAHIGVIKVLEAHGFKPDVVAGTSAGSVVGALYASGMDPFELQQQAFALDEDRIRDVRFFSGGLIEGRKLQDYVNQLVDRRLMQDMRIPFAAVATRLETGERVVFTRGDTGRAVRASSSIPGVFEPVALAGKHYVDGGVTSPVPVDTARELGADIVVAVDISARASGKTPPHLLGIVNQSLAIMGSRLGEQELARADVVIRPAVTDIGPTDFASRDRAILEGERAALAALPQLRAEVAAIRARRAAAAADRAREAARAEAIARCERERSRISEWLRIGECAESLPAGN